ncbi:MULTISPECIES: hypothetical protein [unclassified Streptomyces]|uniref:hypothetical protein n=1 Tax=unclassified Streptomyces TaxID=2593676 RepID=UPI00344E8AC9
MTTIAGTVVYGGPNTTSPPGRQIALLVQALNAEGIAVGSYGKILADQVKDIADHHYSDY